jgi:laminin alpha 1/2
MSLIALRKLDYKLIPLRCEKVLAHSFESKMTVIFNLMISLSLHSPQIYEIYSIKIKSAESPLPKAWILEKSIDGINYTPWQYFASSDADCLARYNLPGRNSNYTLNSNEEIICTTQYSESVRLKYGEAKFVVMSQRSYDTPTTLLTFSLAHHIRLRLQGLVKDIEEIENERTPKWQPDEDDLLKRSYYSIQSIMVIGRCFCSGHAAKCRESESDKLPQCECMHNTCGKNCDKCCPLFNQRPFRVGTPQKESKCEKCQCHGHAEECRYSADIEERSLSENVKGKMSGGGVCVNCTKFTTGINCERCMSGYYRPHDRTPDDDEPCVACECSGRGSIGICNPVGGECVCKPGYGGAKCDACAVGFGGSECERCSCDVRGTVAGGECDDSCQCKPHVRGEKCDDCKDGYFGLSYDNPDGCMNCVCSGLNVTCESHSVERSVVETLEGWVVTDLSKTQIAYPTRDNDTGFYVFGMYELADVEAVYWSAPEVYLGNRLENYGSHFIFQIDYVIVRGDTSGKPTNGPNFILIGRNGMKIAFGDGIFTNSNASVNVPLMETSWYHVPKSVKDIITRLRRTDYKGDPVTRTQFISVISDIESILVRGTYHTDQAEAILKRATLYSGDLTTSNEVVDYHEESSFNLVEKCHCPPGYTGLSCESCMFGHISIVENSSTHEKVLKCLACNCNGHSKTCDVVNSQCGECTHNTTGERFVSQLNI